MSNHRRIGVVETEGGRRLLGAGGEELDRLVSHEAVGLDLRRTGHPQRRHSPGDLTWQMERLPAGGENGDPGAVIHHCPYQLGSRVDHVLAVVQHDDEFPRSELSGEDSHGRTSAGER